MVFFHLFDDEILELYHAKKKFGTEVMAKLREDLYLLLAILPADEVVAISPTFLFENEICEILLKENIEFLYEGFVTIFMKECGLDEFYYKKQERYERVAKYPKYENAYYKNHIDSLISLPFVQEIKNVPIGKTSFSICIELLKKESEANHIPIQDFENIRCRLEETETTSFLWESVFEQLINANVPDKVIRKLRIREIMTRSYIGAYKTEGIALVCDKRIYPYDRRGSDTNTYDLIKIDRILSALNVKGQLMLMPCRELCRLKKNEDYILTIKKVHDLIQEEISIENILQELKKENIGIKLQNIIKDCINHDCERKRIMTDILIMVATKKEEQAIVDKGEWNRKKLLSGQEYFEYEKSGVKFSLVRGYQMGETDAAIMAQKFIENLTPKVIAMAGFCAGKEGDVNLGDVIIASKVYNYDLGKQISETKSLPEISNYSLSGKWLQFIERLDEKWISDVKIKHPVDFNWQMNELLLKLRDNGSETVEKLYSKDVYPDWTKVVEHLKEREYISFNTSKGTYLELTEKGRVHINEYMIKHIENTLPKPKLRIGTIATGTRVQLWENIFQVLETSHDRKTCALDMESHVIGKIGSYNNIPFIVVKGVGDFASGEKAFANRFIEFTSCVSCQFIVDLFSMDRFMPYWKK